MRSTSDVIFSYITEHDKVCTQSEKINKEKKIKMHLYMHKYAFIYVF